VNLLPPLGGSKHNEEDYFYLHSFFGFGYLLMLYLTNSGEVYALELSSLATDREVVVSASIGEPKLTLFGYGPVGSQVTLNGIGILEVTAANDIGYFEFNNVFLPRGGDGTGIFIPNFAFRLTMRKFPLNRLVLRLCLPVSLIIGLVL